MKLLILLFSLLFYSACKKGSDQRDFKRTTKPVKLNISCVKAKIISISCGWYIVQAENNNELGIDGWHDQSGNIYDNVFEIYNLCEVPQNPNKDDIVYFKITEELSGEDCRVCQIGGEIPPPASYVVKDFSMNPC